MHQSRKHLCLPSVMGDLHLVLLRPDDVVGVSGISLFILEPWPIGPLCPVEVALLSLRCCRRSARGCPEGRTLGDSFSKAMFSRAATDLIIMDTLSCSLFGMPPAIGPFTFNSC